MTGLVDVCICTFRRPSLEATLASLAAQRLPDGVTLRVIVADNDERDDARAAIVATGERLGLALDYRHAPSRNISIARNAAFDAVRAPWVAIIDDDEVADPGWLAGLLAAAQVTGADVVLGRVVAIYAPDAPSWMRAGDFHSPSPVFVRGEIQTGYTCNTLLRRDAPALAGRRFRLDLGRSGGEDTEFFHRAFRAGARIVSAPDAVVREAVEPQRASLGWLMRRKYRSGQSHALLLLGDAPRAMPRARSLGVASAKCVLSTAGLLATSPFPRLRAFWGLRAALHAGVVSRLLGAQALTLYGEDKPVAAN